MKPQVPKAYVEWVVEPRFRLNHEDRRYENFWCYHAGQAILHDGDTQIVVDFEVGWKTDITSSPLLFQALVPQTGPHAPAAVLHDRLLDMGLPRAEARRWMWIQLQQLELVSKSRRRVMYAGVWFWDTVYVPLETAKKDFRS